MESAKKVFGRRSNAWANRWVLREGLTRRGQVWEGSAPDQGAGGSPVTMGDDLAIQLQP